MITLVGLAVAGGVSWAWNNGESEGGVPSGSESVSLDSGAASAPRIQQILHAPSSSGVSPTGESATKEARALIQPRDMPTKRMNRPHGKGLAAWQEFYRNVPRHGSMVIDSGSPEFAWWFEDPEMVALFQEEFEKALPMVLQELEERRSRENDPSQIDPGSRAFERNLVRYEQEIEALGFQPDWFRVQEPRSDVARYLSNFLVLQARAAQSGKKFDLEGSPRYRFNTPLDQVVARTAGLDLRTMDSGRVTSLVDSYANTLLQAAEIRTRMQLYEGAAQRATIQMQVAAFSPNVQGAPFSDEVLAFEADLESLWDAFVLEVKGGE